MHLCAHGFLKSWEMTFLLPNFCTDANEAASRLSAFVNGHLQCSTILTLRLSDGRTHVVYGLDVHTQLHISLCFATYIRILQAVF